jgi:4-amino-4-deoxy-L-arabinose transferase-like glycosyltransferase
VTEAARPRSSTAVVLLALALVPYFLVLRDPPLWDANEPLYAEPPREALLTGDWLSPTWNFEPFFAHPPLSTWVTIPFYALLGVSPFAARLPMALAAAATVLGTFAIGRHALGRRAGLLAALVLAATPRVWLYSRQYAGDVYLTALLVWALALAAPTLSDPFGHRRRLLVAHALVGVAALSKSPAVLLYAAPLWLAARLGRPRVPLRALRPWAFVAIVAAVVLPWMAYMTWRHGWVFLRDHVGHHHVRRFVSDDLGSRPPWYYLGVLLGDAQPWVMVLPLAAARALRVRDRRPVAWLPWLAFLFPVVFFSLSVGKRNVYLLPAYPFLALALAPLLLECFEGARPRLARVASALLALGAAGAGVLLLIAGQTVPDLAGPETPLVVICFATAAVLALASASASGRLAVAGVVAGALLLQSAGALLLPALGRYRPVPRLAATIVREAGPQDAVVVYGTSIHSLMYYARRTTTVARNAAQLHAAVPPGGTAWVLVEAREAADVERAGFTVSEVDRAPYLVFQFKRLITRKEPPTKHLVLLRARRPGG